MFDLIKLVPMMPLVGFLINGLFGKKLKNEWLIGLIASGAVGLSFIFVLITFIEFIVSPLEKPAIVPIYEWISAGILHINLSYQVDQLSLLFSLIVTGIGFLIHVYSIGYMHKDRSFARFFAYMNLFIFMMLNLVLASNFLVTFLGWEGVGLCSYLLIGFWYDRRFDGVNIRWTGDAGMKAFIVNRIGDFGFIIAMFLIFNLFGTLDYTSVADKAAGASNSLFATGSATAIALLLFLGCSGKSAQIPLSVWLPDAMAGPTPVSALIHAATMVTAGIFLVARNSVLFALSPAAMTIMMIIGIATAIWAATIGLVQNDIKKVLAYSTVSQLGFMFAALGVGAFSAGVFHVMTHAFFKGLLFLAAGSIIHGMHEEQNIKRMGGLSKYMPHTYLTFFIATMAISGIPLFSGFFSKDEILWNVYNSGGWFAWAVLAIAAFCTAFYMFRLLSLVFYGEERFDKKHIHPHESPKTMTLPLWVLAVLSALGGFLGVPYILGSWLTDHPNILENWLEPVFKSANSIIIIHNPSMHLNLESHLMEYLFMLASVVIALFAISLARNYYTRRSYGQGRSISSYMPFVHKVLLNKYKIDELYDSLIVRRVIAISHSFLWKIFDIKLIDGLVNGSGKIVMIAGSGLRRMQTGLTQNYALIMLSGIIAIIAYFIYRLV